MVRRAPGRVQETGKATLPSVRRQNTRGGDEVDGEFLGTCNTHLSRLPSLSSLLAPLALPFLLALLACFTASAAAQQSDAPSAGDDDLAAAVPSGLHLDLLARVPQRWLHNDTDAYPLRPARWRRRLPPRCRTQGGYRAHCQGPRRVPTPSGAAARLAKRLGLGHRFTARYLMHRRPFDEWLLAVEHLPDARRLTFPVPGGRLGRGFGRTRRGSLRNRRHKGVDIGAPEGAPIVAAGDGLVAYSNNEITGYGNVVILLHREGYSTLYAHCHSTLVAAGQFVRRGQEIARVGDTGFAWAPHLHFEWRQRGWARDPAPHFVNR